MLYQLSYVRKCDTEISILHLGCEQRDQSEAKTSRRVQLGACWLLAASRKMPVGPVDHVDGRAQVPAGSKMLRPAARAFIATV